MTLYRKLTIIILVSFLSIGIDQVTKLVAAKHLPQYSYNDDRQSYLYDTVRIGYTENTGVFLGLGNNLSAELRFGLFVVLVSLLLTGLLWYLITNKELTPLSLTGLSLVFSGGLSNLFDRIINNGAVIDFVNMGIGSLRTGIFNIADVAIMLGLLLFMLFQPKEAENKLPK
jgi:signal peptidase II